MTLEEFNNTQGHCPECGSDNITEERHDDAGLDDVVLMHPFYSVVGKHIDGFYVDCTCLSCGCSFVQRYHLRYAGQYICEPRRTP